MYQISFSVSCFSYIVFCLNVKQKRGNRLYYFDKSVFEERLFFKYYSNILVKTTD